MKRGSGGDGSGERPPAPLTLVRRVPGEAAPWWKRSKDAKLYDALDGTTLAKALADVGVLALAHLARRLCDMDTPEHVKDKIALALGPKVMVQIGVLKHTEDAEGAADLLGAYETAREKLDS